MHLLQHLARGLHHCEGKAKTSKSVSRSKSLESNDLSYLLMKMIKTILLDLQKSEYKNHDYGGKHHMVNTRTITCRHTFRMSETSLSVYPYRHNVNIITDLDVRNNFDMHHFQQK